MGLAKLFGAKAARKAAAKVRKQERTIVGMQLAAAQAAPMHVAAAPALYGAGIQEAGLPLVAAAGGAVVVAQRLLPIVIKALAAAGVTLSAAMVLKWLIGLLTGRGGGRRRRKSKKIPPQLIENLMVLKMTGLPVTKGPGGAIILTKLGKYF